MLLPSHMVPLMHPPIQRPPPAPHPPPRTLGPSRCPSASQHKPLQALPAQCPPWAAKRMARSVAAAAGSAAPMCLPPMSPPRSSFCAHCLVQQLSQLNCFHCDAPRMTYEFPPCRRLFAPAAAETLPSSCCRLCFCNLATGDGCSDGGEGQRPGGEHGNPSVGEIAEAASLDALEATRA
jgi:hypothetical protein